MSVTPTRIPVGIFMNKGYEAALQLCENSMNLGWLSCCSVLILSVPGYMPEMVSMQITDCSICWAESVQITNCMSPQLLATMLDLSILHSTEVEKHTGNCSVFVNPNSLSFAGNPVGRTVPGLDNLFDKVHNIQDVSNLIQLFPPVCWRYLSIVLKAFHFASASVSLSSPYSVNHSIYVTVFLLISSYTSQMMVLLLGSVCLVCEMELSHLLSECCTNRSPPPFPCSLPMAMDEAVLLQVTVNQSQLDILCQTFLSMPRSETSC